MLNRCLGIAKITELTAAISDGYISRAFLTGQDLSHGELHTIVLEGKLYQIRLEGKFLNLRDIEQGRGHINLLRHEPVLIEIIPDSELGYSSVNLTATSKFSLSSFVLLSNSGQKRTDNAYHSWAPLFKPS